MEAGDIREERERRALVARFLRQRGELGQDALVLERVTAPEALELLRRPRPAHGTGGPFLPAGVERAPPGSPPVPPTPPASPPRPWKAEAPVGGEGREDVGIPATPPGELPKDHGELRELCLACTRCRLSQGRTQVVFSDGTPSARVMVVGEAPGANEDASGLPFVGAAGKFLDLLLASVDLSRRDSVYICNVIKCRPPGNRNPRSDEIESCAPYLRAQIGVVRPEAILAVGTFAGQLLTGQDLPLGKLRGRVHAFEGIPLVVTYHPAALLRNSGWTRPTWDDLQLLRSILDAQKTAPAPSAP